MVAAVGTASAQNTFSEAQQGGGGFGQVQQPPGGGTFGQQAPASTGQTVYGGQQPGSQGQQPGYPGQQPGFQGQQPGYGGQQPGYPDQQPGLQGQQPGYGGQQPGYPGQHPGLQGQQPGAGGQQPPGVTGQAQLDPQLLQYLDQLAQYERQDLGVPPTEQLHTGAMHGATPASIPGGQVITTRGLVELIQGRQMPYLLFDVLGSGETLPGAIPAVQASSPGSFGDQISQQMGQYLQQVTQGNSEVPLVFYCLSRECWMSYNAALRAINLGYSNVLWYRGGIEAWKQTGGPTVPAGGGYGQGRYQGGGEYPPGQAGQYQGQGRLRDEQTQHPWQGQFQNQGN